MKYNTVMYVHSNSFILRTYIVIYIDFIYMRNVYPYLHIFQWYVYSKFIHMCRYLATEVRILSACTYILIDATQEVGSN